MHFPEKIYQRIAEASAISGLSIEEFISDVVEREANRVLEDGKFWNMSAEAAVNIQPENRSKKKHRLATGHMVEGLCRITAHQFPSPNDAHIL